MSEIYESVVEEVMVDIEFGIETQGILRNGGMAAGDENEGGADFALR